MVSEIHKCSYDSMEEVTVIEDSLVARGFVKSAEGQSQKSFPLGEYVVVCVANIHHHRNGEIPYRIAWVERAE